MNFQGRGPNLKWAQKAQFLNQRTWIWREGNLALQALYLSRFEHLNPHRLPSPPSIHLQTFFSQPSKFTIFPSLSLGP
ncbi:hypothetical protein L1887_38049 [Cichorium endivia]|nr:hypothetical protein L1887_38049 [Cichorium endivia]